MRPSAPGAFETPIVVFEKVLDQADLAPATGGQEQCKLWLGDHDRVWPYLPPSRCQGEQLELKMQVEWAGGSDQHMVGGRVT